MFRLKRTFQAITGIWLAILLPLETLPAKSYQIKQVLIDATVRQDGSLSIRESRTYEFRGHFRWADYRLPVRGFRSVEHFGIEENGTPYRLSDTEEPGTYTLQQSENEFYAKWFYRVSDETRTFTLSFVLTDIVTVYRDVAELYVQFIGEGWDKPTDSVRVTVHLPSGASRDQIRAWAHGPLWGRVDILDGQTVLFTVAPLPKRTFWEGRILFPTELVPSARKRIAREALPAILAQEKQWAEEANRKREELRKKMAARRARKRALMPISLLLSLLSVGVWFLLLVRNRESATRRFSGKYYMDLPAERPPALVAYLLGNRNVGSLAVLATLMELARKGYCEIEEVEGERQTLFGKKRKKEYIIRQTHPATPQPLQPFEEAVLSMLFQEAGDGKTLPLHELANQRRKLVKWFKKWKELLKQEADKLQFFDQKRHKQQITGIFLGLALILISVPFIVLAGEAGIPLLVAGAFIFFGSLFFNTVSARYASEVDQWKALGRFLRKYPPDSMKQQGLFERIDRLLPYALVLGVSVPRIKKIFQQIPEEQAVRFFWWFHVTRGAGGAGAAFGEALGGMISTAASSFSSATGAGGGATAGGGGGAGGSGGGAG